MFDGLQSHGLNHDHLGDSWSCNAVSWNLVKYCTNVRRIALEKACNRGMTFKATYDFLLDFHWNYVCILYRLRDITLICQNLRQSSDLNHAHLEHSWSCNAVSWNLVKCCTNVWRIALEKAASMLCIRWGVKYKNGSRDPSHTPCRDGHPKANTSYSLRPYKIWRL